LKKKYCQRIKKAEKKYKKFAGLTNKNQLAIEMKSQTVKIQILFIVLISSFMGACRKDITTPNSASEKLFGKWTWIQSSGGIGGNLKSPKTEGYSNSIEFSDKGIYKTFKDGKQTDKMKYSLTEGKSIYLPGKGIIIEFKDIGLFDKDNTPLKQSMQFFGNDTLFLSEECYDCYSHLYVREK
jgi:hypothetical protein